MAAASTEAAGLGDWNASRGGATTPPQAAGYRRSGKTSAQMGDVYQRGEAARGAPHDTVPVRTDTNPPSKPEKASEAAAEEAARAASSSADGSRKSAFDRNGPVEAVALQSDWQFWNIFSDVRTIGKGHFAKVKQVMHMETKEHFAAKILDKALADNDIEDLVREFQMLRALRHNNIIRLYAAYETPRKLYLVTELSTGGELMKRLGSDSNMVYSEDLCKRHVLTIVKAVQYMHSKHCVHRDLKPENVLLSDSSDDAEIKIVDLGLSRFFEERKLMRTICGTHKYLAPELVQCDRGQLQGYDKAIDMWGVGLLAFIMLFGFNPFARDTQRDTHNAIAKCDWHFPDGHSASQGARSFIEALLRKDPQERYSAEQAIRHPWLDPTAPPSPGALLTSDPKRPVKALLWEFNAQRMISKVVKGAHRRMSANGKGDETDRDDD
jgi:calcium/calmodulin-dependent protein kinase I